MSTPQRRHTAAIGLSAATFVAALGLSVCAASPARAANGSLEFCPYLPYLAQGTGQMLQDEYSWTLYQIDPAGHSLLQRQGRDRGCHVVSRIGNAAYQVRLQTDCITGGAKHFRLTGMSAAVWVPEDPAQARTRVDGRWSDC